MSSRQWEEWDQRWPTFRYRRAGCVVCDGAAIDGDRCRDCQRAWDTVVRIGESNVLVIVDGSCRKLKGVITAGVGLVLVGPGRRNVLAQKAIPVAARSGNQAEIEAVHRALRWVPVSRVLTDSTTAIRQQYRSGAVAVYYNGHGMHRLAHELSRKASEPHA